MKTVIAHQNPRSALLRAFVWIAVAAFILWPLTQGGFDSALQGQSRPMLWLAALIASPYCLILGLRIAYRTIKHGSVAIYARDGRLFAINHWRSFSLSDVRAVSVRSGSGSPFGAKTTLELERMAGEPAKLRQGRTLETAEEIAKRIRAVIEQVAPLTPP